MRTLLAPVFSTAAALLLLFAAGCFPAFPPDATPTATGTGGSGQPSGAGGSTGSGATDDLGSAPAGDLGSTAVADLGSSGDLGAVACDKVQPTSGLSSPSGHHNAGQECQGCHAPGNGAPTFYVGGTLYSAVSGGAAVAGATINITDAAGKSVKAISATNGNFWTTTSLTYPIKVNASLCPNTTPMNGAVASNGACNNCHNSTFRVHTP